MVYESLGSILVGNFDANYVTFVFMYPRWILSEPHRWIIENS